MAGHFNHRYAVHAINPNAEYRSHVCEGDTVAEVSEWFARYDWRPGVVVDRAAGYTTDAWEVVAEWPEVATVQGQCANGDEALRRRRMADYGREVARMLDTIAADPSAGETIARQYQQSIDESLYGDGIHRGDVAAQTALRDLARAVSAPR